MTKSAPIDFGVAKILVAMILARIVTSAPILKTI